MPPSKTWKTVEQAVARKFRRAAGPVKQGELANLVSKIGRVGHLLQIDVAAGDPPNGYMGEVKRRRLATWITDALAQAQRLAHEWDRIPIFFLALNSDIKARTVKTKKGPIKLERTWAAFPLDVAAELVLARRVLGEILTSYELPDAVLYWERQVEALHAPGADKEEDDSDV